MPHDYEREMEVAIDAVRQATALCRSVQCEITPDVLAKKDRSPVTVADFGSQALVCRAMHAAFPNDPMVAEEDSSDLARSENAPILEQVLKRVQGQRVTADAQSICDWIDRGHSRSYSDRFWTLDPIDGTKGFLRGEQYAVSLALIVRGTIELGVLGCPNLPFANQSGVGSIFYAVRGHGAWAIATNGPAPPARIHVRDRVDAANARFCESVESGHSSHSDAAALADRLHIKTPPVRMDSQAKYAVVARGDADFYLRLPTRADYREKIWDHAGGAILVTEAGGMVTDINGKPLEFTHGSELVANRGVVVSNTAWHERLLNELQGVANVANST
jgi:3'(2'), 5'-bisphosphate nucleotidase